MAAHNGAAVAEFSDSSVRAPRPHALRSARRPSSRSVASQNGATVATSTRSSGECAPRMVGP